MENDVLKNKIAPWQEHGRWYHLKVNESGWITELTDDYILNNISYNGATGYITFRDKTKTILDYKIIVNSFTATSNPYLARQFIFNNDGTTAITVPKFSTFTTVDADIWLFIA